MARLPRLTLAGHTHHLIQRGNNRQPVFLDRTDRETLLAWLGEDAARLGVALHAYVLMDNHFHLLATPSTADGVPLWMQAVGRRYVRYFNDRHGRSGTLWEGRYRSTLIQSERYLLGCMAYLDLNPVRAGLVEDPAAWAWSSHGHYVGARIDRQLVPHPLYWALGNTPFAREARYAELVRAGLDPAEQARLTDATLHGWAYGDKAYVEALNASAGRRVLKSRAGRRPITRGTGS
ncbi:MAG: transposase [Comamonadaceae bacterium]|nr:MAG: transposase [Comamonadaceae bacterium]